MPGLYLGKGVLSLNDTSVHLLPELQVRIVFFFFPMGSQAKETNGLPCCKDDQRYFVIDL